MQALEQLPEVEKTSLFGTAVHAVLREGSAVASLAPHLERTGLSVDSIEEVVPSLEDVFLDVVDKAGGTVA
jgi:hypothetical protein